MSERDEEGEEEAATQSPPSSPDQNQEPPKRFNPRRNPPEAYILATGTFPDGNEWADWHISAEEPLRRVVYRPDCSVVSGVCPDVGAPGDLERKWREDELAAKPKLPPPPPRPPKAEWVQEVYRPVGGKPRAKDEPGYARIRPWTPLANKLMRDCRVGRGSFPDPRDWEDYCNAGGLISFPGEPERRGNAENKWFSDAASCVRWPLDAIPAAIRAQIWPEDDPAPECVGDADAGVTRADKARAAKLQAFVRARKWPVSGAVKNWAEALGVLRRRLVKSGVSDAEIDRTLGAMEAAALDRPEIRTGRDLDAQWAWVRQALNLKDPPPPLTKRAKLLAARLPRHGWGFPDAELPHLVQKCLSACDAWWAWLKGLPVAPADAPFRDGVLSRLVGVEFHVRWWLDGWHRRIPDLRRWDGDPDALAWRPRAKEFRLHLRDLSRRGAGDPARWEKFERAYAGESCRAK